MSIPITVSKACTPDAPSEDSRIQRYEAGVANGNDGYNYIMTQLTIRERLFVETYCEDFNAGKAAIRAGYSQASASSIGTSLKRRPIIQKALELHCQVIANHMRLAAAEVVHHLMSIATSDIRDIVQWDGEKVTLKKSADIPDGAAIAIAEVSQTAGRFGNNVKVKMVDKLGALNTMAKIVQLAAPDNVEDPDRRAADRLADVIQKALDSVYGAPPTTDVVDAQFTEEPNGSPTP